jgi:hypothetical protein
MASTTPFFYKKKIITIKQFTKNKTNQEKRCMAHTMPFGLT